MHSVFKAAVKALVASGKIFQPVHVTDTIVYLILVGENGETETDKDLFNCTNATGGGICISTEKDYRGIPVGSILLSVSTGIMKQGREVAEFLFGHEYGHHFLGLKSIELVKFEESIAVETSCDNFGASIFGGEGGVGFMNFLLEMLNSTEARVRIRMNSFSQPGIESEWKKTIHAVEVRREVLVAI